MSRKAVAAIPANSLPSVEPVATGAKQQQQQRGKQEPPADAVQSQHSEHEDQDGHEGHETIADWVQNQPQSQPTLAESRLVYESQQPRQILVELPFGRPPSPNESARTGHLNLKGLSTHQRYGLLCLRDGLSRAGATLKNGTPVDRPSHVIRYILEQAIDQAAAS